MYAYLYSKSLKAIVGIADTKEDYEKSEYLKRDCDILMPEEVYSKDDYDETKAMKLFKKANRSWDTWDDNGEISIDIEGDWKHDHIFCDHLMESIGYVKVSENDESSDEDYYVSCHIYKKFGEIGKHKMPKKKTDIERHYAPDQKYTPEYLKELRDIYDIYYTGKGVYAFKVIPMKNRKPHIQLFKENDGQLRSIDVRISAGCAEDFIENLKYAVENSK